MSYLKAICFSAVLCFAVAGSRAQNADSALDKLTNFPTKLFAKVNRQTTTYQNQLTRQTERYLKRMERKEEKLRAAMYKIDSVKAAALYPQDPKQQYVAMMQKFRQDSSKVATSMGPEYLGRLDSLQVTLAFLNKNPDLINANPALQAKMQGTQANLQQLQAKLQAADGVRQFIQSRNAQMQQALSGYTQARQKGEVNLVQ